MSWKCHGGSQVDLGCCHEESFDLSLLNRYRNFAMGNWTYRCYDDGGAPNLWRRWYDANPDFHASHDSTFDILEQRENWGEPHCKYINKNERILEVRLTGKIKYRIFGIYDPLSSARRQFIVLAIGSHKGSVYSPRNVLKTIVSRKVEVLNGSVAAPSCARPQ